MKKFIEATTGISSTEIARYRIQVSDKYSRNIMLCKKCMDEMDKNSDPETHICFIETPHDDLLQCVKCGVHE